MDNLGDWKKISPFDHQYALNIEPEKARVYCLYFTVVTLCHLYVGHGKKTWILKLLLYFVSLLFLPMKFLMTSGSMVERFVVLQYDHAYQWIYKGKQIV